MTMTDEQFEQMKQAVRKSLLEEREEDKQRIAVLEEEVKRQNRQIRSLRADVDTHSQRITFLEGERTDYVQAMTGRTSELRYRLEQANSRLREHDLEPV